VQASAASIEAEVQRTNVARSKEEDSRRPVHDTVQEKRLHNDAQDKTIHHMQKDAHDKTPHDMQKDAQDAIADLKGQLMRFYIAWNVWDTPNVSALAAQHIHSLDTLNARLRVKYHATDLTWTPEKIGLLLESLECSTDDDTSSRLALEELAVQDDSSSCEVLPCNGTHAHVASTCLARATPPPPQDETTQQLETTEQLDHLVNALRTFYNAWQLDRSNDEVATLARDYVHK